MSLKELKQYLRVDYTDDDSMIELMHDAVIDEMKELIPSFDPEKPTNRQKILICSYVKEYTITGIECTTTGKSHLIQRNASGTRFSQ